jgi:hypothetical protein
MNVKTFKLYIQNLNTKYDNSELYVIDVNFKHQGVEIVESSKNGDSVAIVGLRDSNLKITEDKPSFSENKKQGNKNKKWTNYFKKEN